MIRRPRTYHLETEIHPDFLREYLALEDHFLNSTLDPQTRELVPPTAEQIESFVELTQDYPRVYTLTRTA